MSAARVARTGGMLFDGMTGYAVVPISFYGWRELTIAEWIYPVYPKANTAWAKPSMIGDAWVDKVCIYYIANSPYYYTHFRYEFVTRRPDGTHVVYPMSLTEYRNRWVHFALTFSLEDRVLRYYVNGSPAAQYTIPATEKTILEWDPDTARYPSYFRRYVLGASTILAEHMPMIYGSVRIYSKRLRHSDVRLIYERDEPIWDGLECWLPFYENTGNIIRDVSGKGRHATAYGGFRWMVKPAARTVAPARVLPRAR